MNGVGERQFPVEEFSERSERWEPWVLKEELATTAGGKAELK